MPKLNDPNFKLRLPNNFVRKKLRPWNIVEELQNSLSNDNENSNQIVNTEETISKLNRNNEGTVNKQIVNNEETYSKQLKSNQKQIVNNKKTISNPVSKQINGTINKHKVTHLVNNETDYWVEEIHKLTGLQWNLLMYVIENCSSRGLLQTTPITNQTLKLLLQTDIDSAKTTIQRLVNKKIISRINGRRGRGGFCIFRITEEVRNIALEAKRQLSISEQIVNQIVNRSNKQIVNNNVTNQETSPLSSSGSINDIKNTTNTVLAANLLESLPLEWQEIDLSELHKRGVHFSREQLSSLWTYLKNFSAFDFQESIDSFVYDIDNKYIQARKGYLNLFIGIIRNNQLYISAHYISPARKLLVEINERAKKLKEEKDTYNESMENEAFNKWFETSNIEEIKEQMPPYILVDFNCKGNEYVKWIKDNIYKKILHENASSIV